MRYMTIHSYSKIQLNNRLIHDSTLPFYHIKTHEIDKFTHCIRFQIEVQGFDKVQIQSMS